MQTAILTDQWPTRNRHDLASGKSVRQTTGCLGIGSGIAIGRHQDCAIDDQEVGIGRGKATTLNIVDRAYLIFEGRVRRHGTKDFLVNDDEARRLYLGKDFSM